MTATVSQTAGSAAHVLESTIGTEALTAEALAERLHVSPQTVYRWRTVGVRGVRLPALRLGSAFKFAPVDVQQFLLRLSGRPDETPQTERAPHGRRRRLAVSPENAATLASCGIPSTVVSRKDVTG